MGGMIKGITFLSLTILATFNSFALSATTAQTIQGNRPVINKGSLAAHSVFILDGDTHSEKIDGKVFYIFDKTKKLGDFTILGLSINDTLVSNYYSDMDGDAYKSSSLSVGSSFANWTTYDDQPINHLTSSLDNLANTYQFPLKLTITTPNVIVKSQYGDPEESDPVTVTQTYLIDYEDKIEYLKPYSTESESGCQWKYKTNNLESNNLHYEWNCTNLLSLAAKDTTTPGGGGGGINASEYVPDKGFKANLTDKFPTTGFDGAKFKVIMVGNQGDYKFYSSNAHVDVNLSTGEVTLKSKPSSPVTITAELIANSAIKYSYEFTIKTWVEPKVTGEIDYAEAVAQCGGNSNNILTRADLTNSPVINVGENSNWSFAKNYGTRGVGSLYSEWGHLYHYTSSDPTSLGWNQGSPYWTKDEHSTGNHFFVNPSDGGYIGNMWDSSNDGTPGMRVACIVP